MIEKIIKNLFDNSQVPNEEEITNLKKMLEKDNNDLIALRKETLLVEILLEYYEKKKSGINLEELKKEFNEDLNEIYNAEEFVKKHLKLKNNLFGYPTNMYSYDAVEKYLRELENKCYLMNNCGGPNHYDNGYYQMDSKQIECEIFSLFCKNLNINPENYWGYITSGGTEGNHWGIRTGFEIYPDGKLYYSKNAHYSIAKYNIVNDKKTLFPYEEIETLPSGEIDANMLIKSCKSNWQKYRQPCVIVLTWGTTLHGSIDDIKYVKRSLEKAQIPHYIHLDAAMYGGIPNNQLNAPNIGDLKELNPDSISISLHKYFGLPLANGIVICKKEVYDKKTKNQIEYIGQADSTLIGSRSFLPFVTLHRIKRILKRSDPHDYERNINIFIDEMTKKGIPYLRYGNGNTFVIDLPSASFAQKYQLATFDNDKKAHIIILPSQESSNIKAMVNDLHYYRMSSEKEKVLEKV